MAITLVNIGTGVRTGDGDALRLAFSEVNTSLTDLDTRLKTNTALLGTLGAAAFLNIGAAPGTVADGGALAAEIARAQAAEQANTTLINNEVSRAQTAEALKAPIASPTFTGIPRAPTATAGTGGTQIATLDFVATAVAAGGGGGGGGGGGVPPTRQILASGLATGGGDLTADRTITVTAASQSDVATGTDQTKALTPFSIAAALGAKAPLASPALVGTPTAPTATAGTNTTQIATTAFVTSAVGNVQRTAFRFVATQGQTTFTGTDAAGLTLAYTAGLVSVFVNGRRLSPPDFTAPDGTGVYIPTGVNAGDEILIIADAAFSVANTYTQAQIDASFAANARRRNRIIDPGMRVSQEQGNNLLTLANTGVYYPSDSIVAYRAGSTGGAAVQRVALTTPGGSPNRVRVTVTAANASPAAGDQTLLVSRVEGLDVADLKFGTAGARTIAVRFGVRSSVAGTFPVAIQNGNGGVPNRSWVGSFTVAAGEVGTDVVKSVTLTGDTTGTWAADNTTGLQVGFGLCAGSNVIGVTGWQAGNFFGLASATNLMATNGATFDLFDVGLYDVTGLQSGVIPPFELDAIEADVRKCQRYYSKSYDIDVSPGANTAQGSTGIVVQAASSYPSWMVFFANTMRTIPTVTVYSQNGVINTISNGAANLPASSPGQLGTKSASLGVNNSSVAATSFINCHYVANARL